MNLPPLSRIRSSAFSLVEVVLAVGIMALGVMAFYGGDALFAFAVSMIFGIVIGTYSSIYVAAPAMRYLYSREKEGRRREAAAGDEAVGMGE